MITKKQVARLKQRIDQGDLPILNHQLWNALEQTRPPYNWSFTRDFNNFPAINALVKMGLIDRKNRLTTLGKLYQESCNGFSYKMMTSTKP